ncbi:hypothetical protein BS47DRAFT_1392973 [Hydnum rufescens UP504]|uniref:Defect at low temperature protein 1 n=1 Tax=Hydnum rufescens UP504 TaxID=1448309 RepID=A0A9P6DWL3_9AGAM|nr:hypothetical protein BS47DRAFT_1392973 [Hydnum rufescens UP504]
MALLYDLSFAFFVFITGVAVLASGASLVFQAVCSSEANWNVISIVASYVALAIVTVAIYLSRKITTVHNLRGIPKTFVAIKDGDVPKPVAELVATEYDRVCAISQIAQPQITSQEGWGSPGTALEGVHFRRTMLNTLSTVTVAIFPTVKTSPISCFPSEAFGGWIAARDPTWLRRYDTLIQQARYAEREPSRLDCEECEQLASYLTQIFQLLSDPRLAKVASRPPSDDASYATAPSGTE